MNKNKSIDYSKISINGFDNKPVPFKRTIFYPQPPEKTTLPNNFFTALIIGSTGSGKSYSVAKLLKYYEIHKIYDKEGEIVPQRIILISPSIDSNEVFSSLKNLADEDKFDNYSDKLLQNVLDDIELKKQQAEKYQSEIKLWKRFLNVKTLNQLTSMQLLKLHQMNFTAPIKPEWTKPPVIHLVLDDLLNNPNAYKATGKSLINQLAVRNRHLGINMYILAQTASQVPKCVRSQARLLMLYRYNSKNIVDDLYEIVSGVLTPEQFEKMYLDNTQEKYSFFTIDNTHKDIMFKQNLDNLLIINKLEKDS
jgi:hypothetical protein